MNEHQKRMHDYEKAKQEFWNAINETYKITKLLDWLENKLEVIYITVTKFIWKV